MEKFYILESGLKKKAGQYICKNCNVSFLARIKKNRKNEYCSKKCFGESKKLGQEKICSYCETNFYISKSRIKLSKSGLYFCNKKCLGKYYTLHPEFSVPKDTKERRIKISIGNKGKIISLEQRIKISLTLSGRRKYKTFEELKRDADLDDYRLACAFHFKPENYPEEFNLDLVETFGKYSYNKNTNGIVKDHMVSIKYGFENKIDPQIIGHPANCELMRQCDNIKKFDECSITLDELKQRIIEWNIKYKVGN